MTTITGQMSLRVGSRCPLGTTLHRGPLRRPMLHADPCLTHLRRRTRNVHLPRRWTSLGVFPFDQAWAPNVDQASLAPPIFAASLVPYLFFLFYLTRSNKTPPMTLFGFYFLLVFVAVSIPAGIYAKTHYDTSLSNVDWLHGGAELFLTITNLFIVLGLRRGIREAKAKRQMSASDEKTSSS